jgi:hypothetical protein
MRAPLPMLWSEQATMLDSLGVFGAPPPAAG